jgi:hypothetical protein
MICMLDGKTSPNGDAQCSVTGISGGSGLVVSPKTSRNKMTQKSIH